MLKTGRVLFAAVVLALAVGAPPARAVVTGTSSRNDLAGDGSTKTFSFTFKTPDKTWVKVYVGGVLTSATVSLNGNQDVSPGGTVTLAVAPITSATVRVQRETPKTQGTAYSAYTAFPAKTHEAALDRATMQTQEVDRHVADAEATHAADTAAQAAATVAGDAAERAFVAAMLGGIGAPEANAARITAEELHTAGYASIRSYGAHATTDVGCDVTGTTWLGIGANPCTNFNSTTAVQSAINYCESGNRVACYIPSGIFLHSGLSIVTSLTMFGNGKLGLGASILRYTGAGTAVLVSSGTASPIYSVSLKNFSLQSVPGSGATAGLKILHGSECQFDDLTVGGSLGFSFATGVYLERTSITTFKSLLVSFTSVAGMHFAAYSGDRFAVNGHTVVSDGDFFANPAAFLVEAASGLNIHGNWIESSDHVLKMDDSVGLVESDDIWIHNNSILMNGNQTPTFYTNQLLGYFKNVGTNLFRALDVRFTENRVAYAGGGLSNVTHPVVVDFSGTTDSATQARITLRDNGVKGAHGELVTANSSKAWIHILGGRNIDGSTLVDLPSADATGTGLVSVARYEGTSAVFGANNDWGAGSDLSVYNKTGATTMNIRAGAVQAGQPLVGLYNAAGSFMGGIDAAYDFLAYQGLFVGANGTEIKQHVSGLAVWDPPSVADGAVTSTTVSVPFATVGNTVAVGFSTPVPAGALLVGAVTATGTITVTLFNKTGAPIDLASGNLRADAWAH